MTSATALRAMCGKPGVAKKLLKEVDGANVHAAGAAAAEALGDGAIDQPPSEAESSVFESPACVLACLQSFATKCYARLSTVGHVCRMTHGERLAYQNAKGLGHLYTAFEDHKDGLEACAAVEALIEISAIETLRSSFLLPLQGDAVAAEVCRSKRMHLYSVLAISDGWMCPDHASQMHHGLRKMLSTCAGWPCALQLEPQHGDRPPVLPQTQPTEPAGTGEGQILHPQSLPGPGGPCAGGGRLRAAGATHPGAHDMLPVYD